MVKKKLIEILNYLKQHNLLTSTPTNEKVYEKFLKENGKIKFILTHGIPEGQHICSKCDKYLLSDQFNYYMARVDQEGYLSRSNAICKECSKKIIRNVKSF